MISRRTQNDVRPVDLASRDLVGLPRKTVVGNARRNLVGIQRNSGSQYRLVPQHSAIVDRVGVGAVNRRGGLLQLPVAILLARLATS